jgi:hypothetical protein
MLTLEAQAHQWVKRSPSCPPREKYYWEKTIPSMTGEQLLRFCTIFETEQVKLEELERKFKITPKEQREKEGIEIIASLDEAIERNRKFRLSLQ